MPAIAIAAPMIVGAMSAVGTGMVVASGALGAILGGVGAALTGGDFGKGMLMGAATGLVGGGLAVAAAPAAGGAAGGAAGAAGGTASATTGATTAQLGTLGEGLSVGGDALASGSLGTAAGGSSVAGLAGSGETIGSGLPLAGTSTGTSGAGTGLLTSGTQGGYSLEGAENLASAATWANDANALASASTAATEAPGLLSAIKSIDPKITSQLINTGGQMLAGSSQEDMMKEKWDREERLAAEERERRRLSYTPTGNYRPMQYSQVPVDQNWTPAYARDLMRRARNA